MSIKMEEIKMECAIQSARIREGGRSDLNKLLIKEL
jgi:hypothetical protein